MIRVGGETLGFPRTGRPLDDATGRRLEHELPFRARETRFGPPTSSAASTCFRSANAGASSRMRLACRPVRRESSPPPDIGQPFAGAVSWRPTWRLVAAAPAQAATRTRPPTGGATSFRPPRAVSEGPDWRRAIIAACAQLGAKRPINQSSGRPSCPLQTRPARRPQLRSAAASCSPACLPFAAARRPTGARRLQLHSAGAAMTLAGQDHH